MTTVVILPGIQVVFRKLTKEAEQDRKETTGTGQSRNLKEETVQVRNQITGTEQDRIPREETTGHRIRTLYS